ncbi:STAS-like domain-containing protein [Fusobacterium sp.]|uniref:STAS-like domain-containing protein n=1 Tax=Fusobacterium sp. TaxID=68766 RepID=UPI00396CB6E1
MRLILKKLFNTSVLVSPIKAMKLYEILSAKIKDGKSVNIDFLGIEATTIAFIYIVFSNLIKECQKNVKDLRDFISISNAPEVFIKEVEYLKDNYKKVSSKLDSLNYSLA